MSESVRGRSITFKCPICGREVVGQPELGYLPNTKCFHYNSVYQMEPIDADWAREVKMWENECGWVDAVGGWHSKEGL